MEQILVVVGGQCGALVPLDKSALPSAVASRADLQGVWCFSLSIICTNASLSIGGSCFPRFSALRSIPSQAVALSQYLQGALASKVEDKVYPLSALSRSDVLSIKNSVSKAPSVSAVTVGVSPPSLRNVRHNGLRLDDFDEFLKHGSEVLASVGAKSSWYVFPNNESWASSFCTISHLLYNSYGLVKQTASCGFLVSVFVVLDACSLACDAHVLARRTEGDNINRLDLGTVDLADIPKMLHRGES